MTKYVCTVCGYIAEGSIPEFCPVCKAPASKFIEKKDNTYVTEHVVGIAKDVPEEIKQGLRENFNGECSEVGMYLAMARVAEREGYPEIGLYWEKAAFEEARKTTAGENTGGSNSDSNNSNDNNSNIAGEEDKAVLLKLVQSQASLDGAQYTQLSWYLLQIRLGDAQEVLESAESTKKDVSCAQEKLQAAINALQKNDTWLGV